MTAPGPVVPTPPAEVPQELVAEIVRIGATWPTAHARHLAAGLLTEWVSRMVAERVRAARDEDGPR